MITERRYLWLIAPLATLQLPLGLYGYELTGWAIFCWLPLLNFHIFFPMIDHLLGLDTYTPPDRPENQSDGFYSFVARLTAAICILIFISVVIYVLTHDLSWGAFLGLAFSTGSLGGQSINTAHELGHKNNAVDRALAKVLLAISAYGHFYIEHTVGHHRDVATPEDSASARFGESLYQFIPREWIGGLTRSWDIEKKRLEKLGTGPWTWQNQIVQPMALTLVLFGALTASGGWLMLLFLIIQAFEGWFLLSIANYVEHYGLLRQRTASGRYERCQPKHSWNANFLFSNLLLLNLQRHSDHHAYPARSYQDLRTYDDVPTFPSGYPLMFTLAMVPPVWRAVMDHRVLAWAGGDSSKLNCG